MKVSFWRIALAYFGTPFLFGAAFIQDKKITFFDYIVVILQMGLVGMIFMSIPALILSIICWGLSKWLKNTTKVAFIMFFVTFFLLYSGFALMRVNNEGSEIFTLEDVLLFTPLLFPSALISSSLYYFFNRPKKNDPSKIVDE